MPKLTLANMFSTPKKRGRPATRKARACAPKVPYNECESNKANCMWVYGKREYCRTRRNKKRV
jgi:hypothetical protein